MEPLPTNALSFLELLVRAHDAETLYRSFQLGLGALFEHHSLVASFAFDREYHGPTSVWSYPPRAEHTPEYWERNAKLHPGFGYTQSHPGIKLCLCSDVLTSDELDRHAYFHEFMKPEGYRHAMAILIWDGPQLLGYLAINRSDEQGDFTDDERKLALTLHPLIQAAYERIAEAHAAVDARLAQERLLASLPLAAIVYAAKDRRVLFHNRAAKDALAKWRGESAKKRPRSVTARWLPAEIVEACTALSSAGTTIRAPRAAMRAVLRRMDKRSHFASDVVLIVIEDDGAITSRPSNAWLQVARSLTTAEQDVAKLAAVGHTNAEIGKQLGKSALTVKKQLESVFAKARVSNRAELTAVVAGFRGSSRRKPS